MADGGKDICLPVEECSDTISMEPWNWTEKNAFLWSKNKISELLLGLEIKTDLGIVKIAEIMKCEGNAVVYNRKDKYKSFYEIRLEIKWQGITIYGVVIEGRVIIPYFSEEYDINDTDIITYYEDDGAESTCFGLIMRDQGEKAIKELLSLYIAALEDEFSKQFMMSDSQTDMQIEYEEKFTLLSQEYEQKIPVALKNNLTSKEYDTEEIHGTEVFKCMAEEFYRILTDKELIQAFTKSDCVSEPKEGGVFEHFNGNVKGYFVQLQTYHTIVLKWRLTSWPKDYFSDVIINIKQKIDSIEVKWSQFGVPKQALESTKDVWVRQYWNNIKETFGFGPLC